MAATSAQLYGSAHFIAQECKAPNTAYLLCKQQSMNPASCLAEGAGVKTCVDDLVKRLHATCDDPYNKYQKCLADSNNAIDKCAKQKTALNACYEATKAATAKK